MFLRLLNLQANIFVLVLFLGVLMVYAQLAVMCYELWKHPEIGYHIVQSIQVHQTHKHPVHHAQF